MLDFLGRRYGTDKSSEGTNHNYLVFYQLFLEPFRNRETKLLEIGVGEGSSLRMWKDYFQRGHIVGMDLAPDRVKFAEERIAVEIGDQAKAEDLRRVAAKHGPFSIIVDDAGHRPDDQIFCYREMVPYIEPGGLYILEDIGGTPTYDFLMDIARNIAEGNGRLDNPDGIGWRELSSIAFYSGTSITTVN